MSFRLDSEWSIRIEYGNQVHRNPVPGVEGHGLPPPLKLSAHLRIAELKVVPARNGKQDVGTGWNGGKIKPSIGPVPGVFFGSASRLASRRQKCNDALR